MTTKKRLEEKKNHERRYSKKSPQENHRLKTIQGGGCESKSEKNNQRKGRANQKKEDPWYRKVNEASKKISNTQVPQNGGKKPTMRRGIYQPGKVPRRKRLRGGADIWERPMKSVKERGGATEVINTLPCAHK